MSLLDFACRHRFPGGFELNLAFTTDRRVTSLFGPSGSGKTSVLSMIAGFLPPQEGAVRLRDRLLTQVPQGVNVPPEKRRVGFVFQDHLLFPHLDVEQNLLFGAKRRQERTGRRIDLERVAQVLELIPLLSRRPKNLSGGERQRVAIGRALLSQPDLLLLDEPLASLDEALRGRVLSYVERVVEEWDLPTLFVSHDQASVRRLAEWVVVLNRGSLVTCGPPAEALAQPELFRWRAESGPINLLRVERVEAHAGGWRGFVGGQPLQLPQLDDPPGDSVFVQFPPSAVTLSRQDVAGLSARNHLRGEIRQMIEVPHGVFVAVDVGQILWSDVTPAAVAELNLQPGVEVYCLIKTVGLHVV